MSEPEQICTPCQSVSVECLFGTVSIKLSYVDDYAATVAYDAVVEILASGKPLTITARHKGLAVQCRLPGTESQS